jgi:hypothetical protein
LKRASVETLARALNDAGVQFIVVGGLADIAELRLLHGESADA